MFTYWLPWPGKRKASLSGGGPEPRKIPCEARACERLGGLGGDRLLRLAELLEELLARSEVDRRAARARRGRRRPARRRAAAKPPSTRARSASRFVDQRRERSLRRPCDAARRRLRSRCRRGREDRRGLRRRRDRDLKRRLLRRQRSREVLLENDVEVGPAEAVGRDAGAPAARRRPSSTRRGRGSGRTASPRSRCSGSASRR